MAEYVFHVDDRYGKTSVVPLDRFPFTIGRGPENNLVISEPSVSRQHAYIRKVPEGLSIVDNESRNGIFVNNQKVFKVRLLNPGDVLRIGSAKLKLNHANNPEIPLVSRPSETIQYIPSRDTWDPVKSLAAGLPVGGQAGAPQKGRRSPSWQSMLPRLFVQGPISEVYEQILNMIEETISFDRCFIILFDKGNPDQSQVVTQRIRSNRHSEVIVSKNVLRRVAKSSEAVLVSAKDVSYVPTESFIKSGADGAICVPLIVGGEATGVIYLDRVQTTLDFSREDIETIGPLAGLVAMKLENLRLLNDHVASQLVMRDLELAKVIQEDLLPREPMTLPGFRLEGYSSPCFHVGGDYFDFYRQPDQKVTLVIGDVSGKGLSSAMYMAGVRSTLHAHLEDGLQVDVLMARLERHVSSTFRSDHFLTLFVGRIEPERNTLTYCNAGHIPPIGLTRTGEPFELEATAPALNIAAWGKFACNERVMEPGELLLLYTDGLIEAENSLGEQFGKDRLTAALIRLRDKDLTLVRKELLAELDAFVGGNGPSDDRTLILVRREDR